MGRRRRQRDRLAAHTSEYVDEDGSALVLRGSMTLATRQEYGRVVQGGLDREDAWQRAVEFLFERLAVSWSIAGLEITRQKELLARYRVASLDERQFIRGALRDHLAEHFPEMLAP